MEKILNTSIIFGSCRELRKSLRNKVPLGQKRNKRDAESITSKEILFDGMPAYAFSVKGRDEDGPTNVNVLIVSTYKNERLLMIYAWGSDKSARANGKAIDAILGSVILLR